MTDRFIYLFIRDLQSFEILFDSKVMGRFANFRIGRAYPLLVVVKRLKPLTALSGTVYRLASSMSDHTTVLFNTHTYSYFIKNQTTNVYDEKRS